MAEKLNQNLKFEVKELSLITRLGKFDITGIYEELNIFDSVFNPCMTGNILITDSNNIAAKLAFDGSEMLKVVISKMGNIAGISKTFKIYEMSKRVPLNPTTEQYSLNFVSEEFYNSRSRKVYKTYEGKTYSEIVANILTNELKVKPSQTWKWEATAGMHDVTLSGKQPIECILDCTKKAVSLENDSPTFMFYENKMGYSFYSIAALAKQNAQYQLNYEPKNFGNTTDNSLFGARYMEVVSQYNLNENAKNGIYGTTTYSVDHLSQKIYTQYQPAIVNMMDSLLNLNETGLNAPPPEWQDDGSSCVKVFYGATTDAAQKNSFITANEPYSINKIDDGVTYIAKRPALMRNYMGLRIKLVMPGNFDLICGAVVELHISNRGTNVIGNSVDESLSGKYIILAARQMVKYDRHETVIEISTDSTNRTSLTNADSLRYEQWSDNYG